MQRSKEAKVVSSVLLIALLVVPAFAVYAGGQSEAESERVEITYMAWYNTETEPAETQVTLDLFNESQDDIHVRLISVPYAEYSTRLNTMAASGDLPDTAMMLENQVIRWAAEGALTDVSEMYSSEAEPLDSLAFTYKGTPVAYSVANEVLVLYYNRDLFDEAGLPYPPANAEDAWTWDEFVEVAKQLTKDRNGNSPDDPDFDSDNIVTYGADFNRLSWMWPVLAVSNGGGVISPDGQELLLGEPETIEAAQAIADLHLEHHVAPSPSVSSSLSTLDVNLLTGRVAMATSGQWEIGVSLKNSIDEGLDYGVAVLPKMDRPVTYNTGGANVIFESTEDFEAAQTFMKWYTSEENNLSLIQGGVWMPVSREWYQDEELMRKWADTDIHPPFEEYRSAVIEYSAFAEQVPWYFFPGYDRIDTIIDSGMDPVWSGRKSARDALLNDIVPNVRPIFEENRPR